MNLISNPQLKRLQTLWGIYSRHVGSSPLHAMDRAERLKFCAIHCGRDIASTKDLTAAEANDCINALQRAVGQKETSKPRRPRKSDPAAGTAGRVGNTSKVDQIASATDLDRINEAITRLGWDQSRFHSWLNSSSSPLRGRANAQVRTQADANRVWWALKRMLKHKGLWRSSSAACNAEAAS